MEKIKLNLEIDKDVYEKLKQQLADQKDPLGNRISAATIDEYIGFILSSYIKSGEQIKGLGSKFTDFMENFTEKMGDIDLQEIIKGAGDLGQGFGTNTKKEDEKKSKEKEELDKKLSGLKN